MWGSVPRRRLTSATRPLASVPWLGDGDPTEWDEEATTATPILTAPLLEAETKKCSKKTVVEGAKFLQAAKYYFNQIAAQKRARLRVACDALAATRPLTSVPSLGEATPATSMGYPLRSTGPASSSEPEMLTFLETAKDYFKPAQGDLHNKHWICLKNSFNNGKCGSAPEVQEKCYKKTVGEKATALTSCCPCKSTGSASRTTSTGSAAWCSASRRSSLRRSLRQQDK
ncbi:uncharacterized protein LOC110435993 [Sorghum bicolor]|nr:uncharacterized protein LOC110435993 [Sorghum bicolor]|eukprot:XP_021317803.1 uncharacterized protein LOC110435993 [Sorghum bicolor]